MTSRSENRRNPFRDPGKRAAYDRAVELHEVLKVELSGRGNAYRRGLAGAGWDKRWTSYPVYRAGLDRRRIEQREKN